MQFLLGVARLMLILVVTAVVSVRRPELATEESAASPARWGGSAGTTWRWRSRNALAEGPTKRPTKRKEEPLGGPSNSTEVVPRRRSALSYWPGVLGLAAATFQLVTGVAAESVALTVTVAASCYLAAAVLGQRWIAWAGVLTGSVVVTASEVVGVPWWLGLAVYGAVLVLVGLVRRASVRRVTAQGLAMLGFGGLAVAAVLVSPRLGLAMAGFALTTHAGWDYIHWRRNEVVPRSLAEFCIVLDLLFGAAAIVLAFTG